MQNNFDAPKLFRVPVLLTAMLVLTVLFLEPTAIATGSDTTNTPTATVMPEPTTTATRNQPSEGLTVWSADMSVVDYGTGAIGAGSADLLSNQGGSEGLEAIWIWYYAPYRELNLAFTTGINTTGLTLHAGSVAVALPEGDSGNPSFTLDVADVDWTGGQTIEARLVRAESAPVQAATDTPVPTQSGCVYVHPSPFPWRPNTYLKFPSNSFLAAGYISLYSDSGCQSAHVVKRTRYARVYTIASQSDATDLCVAGYNDGCEWTSDKEGAINIWRCIPVNPTITPTATPSYTPTPIVAPPTNVSAVLAESSEVTGGLAIVVSWDPPPNNAIGYDIDVQDPANEVRRIAMLYHLGPLAVTQSTFSARPFSAPGTYTVKVRFKRWQRPGAWSESVTLTIPVSDTLVATDAHTTRESSDSSALQLQPLAVATDTPEPSPTDTLVAQQQQVLAPTAILGSAATDTLEPTATDTPEPTATDTIEPTTTATPAGTCENVGPGTYWLFPANNLLSGLIIVYPGETCEAVDIYETSIGESGYVYTPAGQAASVALCAAAHSDGSTYTSQQQAFNNDV